MVEPIVTLGVTILFATLFTVLFVMTILIQLDTLNTISNSDKSNKKDYITIMYENIDKLKKELY